MKALILAAGLGSRLSPITDDIPKSMVEVNGTPILFRQLDNLLENGINDIVVIAGYKAEIIITALEEKYPSVEVVVNDDFSKTNNMYSAYMAKSYMYGCEFLLMNADVYFDSIIVNKLIGDAYRNAIVVEVGIHNDESMKVKCLAGRITEISKAINESEAYGVSIDVYKFSRNGSVVFFDKIMEYVETKKELNKWTEVALNDILRDVEFNPCPLNGRWMEIDTHDDLKKAEKLFK